MPATATSRKLPDAFSKSTCQRLRKLAIIGNQAISNKKAATELRDALCEQINQATAGERARVQRLKADERDAIHEIEYWAEIKKESVNKIVDTIERGSDPELIPTLNPNPTAKTLLDEGAAPDGDGDADEPGDEADKD